MNEPHHEALQRLEQQLHAQHGQIAALTLIVSTCLSPPKMTTADQKRRIAMMQTAAIGTAENYQPEARRVAFAEGMQAVLSSVLAGWDRKGQT